jgi:secreted Zn-dependent insulinase-like peptidase
LAGADPINSNMNALYVELIEDSLTEFVYPAQLGGLQYELTALNYGIQVDKYKLKMITKKKVFLLVKNSWI